MKRIVIFASGSGTNAENIIEYFKEKEHISVAMVLSNKREAKVLDRAERHKISSLSFNRTAFLKNDHIKELLKSLNPDLIVLAGFLWKFPESIIAEFPDRIVNIHPALLPKYGGKGMYGMNVHKAVVENGEKETGISIHYVNENYDEGAIIFQARTEVLPSDSPEEVAAKVHQLEYEHFPVILENLLHE
ncbi:phosphoribosylglycinamide formyltransferase [Leptobacterium flavescens]|uniref:Phosphoribosylglycinamide formyltransferase n=1 Tax=Leptobacterium flavescens TaxID=472055 RepID=A0A6P0UP94_9FLAO|nr:phosphoribosylglycinamide formyltransferase [Leptobacterium flavescens]NER14312.1 phosphoribosylglycinamide formyltransferase [Leptobacterium flavescens]